MITLIYAVLFILDLMNVERGYAVAIYTYIDLNNFFAYTICGFNLFIVHTAL